MTDDAYERWQRETYEPAVRRVPERKPAFPTESGIEPAPLYGPDGSEPSEEERLGYPGEYPFTRGVQPTMYRGRLWTMRQYAGYSTPEDSNARYRFLLSQGRPASRSRSTSRRRPATTQTTTWRDRRSARSACPYPASRTWRRCSTASRSAT